MRNLSLKFYTICHVERQRGVNSETFSRRPRNRSDPHAWTIPLMASILKGPGAFVSTRAHVCAFVHVRMCTRARSRRFVRTRCLTGPRPAFDYRAQTSFDFQRPWGAMGCHVKLHRRAFLSHSHVYTRPPLKTRVPRGRTRSRVCPGWADPTFTHVPSQLSREIVSWLLGLSATFPFANCETRRPIFSMRTIISRLSRTFEELRKNVEGASSFFFREERIRKDHDATRVDFCWLLVNI